MRRVDEEWLLDHDPESALRSVVTAVGALRDRSVEAPMTGVVVVTHREVTWLTMLLCVALAPFTVGISLLGLLFAKSSFPCTVRAEPDAAGGTRLSIVGRANGRTMQAIAEGLGVDDRS